MGGALQWGLPPSLPWPRCGGLAPGGATEPVTGGTSCAWTTPGMPVPRGGLALSRPDDSRGSCEAADGTARSRARHGDTHGHGQAPARSRLCQRPPVGRSELPHRGLAAPSPSSNHGTEGRGTRAMSRADSAGDGVEGLQSPPPPSPSHASHVGRMTAVTRGLPMNREGSGGVRQGQGRLTRWAPQGACTPGICEGAAGAGSGVQPRPPQPPNATASLPELIFPCLRRDAAVETLPPIWAWGPHPDVALSGWHNSGWRRQVPWCDGDQGRRVAQHRGCGTCQ